MYPQKTVCYQLSRAQITVMMYEPDAPHWAHKWNYKRTEAGQKSAERKITKLQADGYEYIGEQNRLSQVL